MIRVMISKVALKSLVIKKVLKIKKITNSINNRLYQALNFKKTLKNHNNSKDLKHNNSQLQVTIKLYQISHFKDKN